MKKVILLGCVILFSKSLFGQFEPKHTFNMEVGMPVPIANKSFKGIMKGVVSISPYYQYRLSNSLAFGTGIQYNYLQVNPTKVPPSEKAKGGMHSVGVFLKVSKEKFHNEQFATDFGVKMGYSQTYFVTDSNEKKYGKPQQVNSISIAPMLGLILSVDEFSSYRFTLGYTVQGFGFSPQRIGIATNGGYDPDNFSNPTHYLIVGFGFTHYFHKKSSE
jgi:hypothetical protein